MRKPDGRQDQSDAESRLHWHRCYSCEDMLVCACGDRRQRDRETGKERRIYCFGCWQLQEALAVAELDKQVTLEKVN
jgi:hypothetical protein